MICRKSLTGFIFIVVISYVHSLNDDEIKAEFTKYIMKCLKDNPVETMELMRLQQLVPPKSKACKCLLACAYKAEGSMNAQGMYDLEHAQKVAELAKDGDENRLINGKKIIEICSKINDVKVSDGEEGCERAALLFKCSTENAKKFGFKI